MEIHTRETGTRFGIIELGRIFMRQHWMRILLKIAVFSVGFTLVACSKVKFTEKPALAEPEECESFGNQGCDVDPETGFKQFDNEIIVGLRQADILIVDDNSGSMSVEQSKMGEKFPNFINSLSDIDFRIAITTTDITEGGGLIEYSNGATVLTPTMENIVNLFRDAVQRPETAACEASGFDSEHCPSPDERGIYAANLIVADQPEGFFRDGAHFAMIILSDEDERSSGNIPGYPLENGDLPETLIENVKSTFDNSKSFAVHSIIIEPGDTTCLAQQDAQHGVRGFEGHIYAELSQLTNGSVGSICESDFGQELGQIGSAVVDDVNSMDLACIPANDEVEVSVIPDQFGLEFTLDKEAKKIRFNQSISPGSKVRISYECPN